MKTVCAFRFTAKTSITAKVTTQVLSLFKLSILFSSVQALNLACIVRWFRKKCQLSEIVEL